MRTLFTIYLDGKFLVALERKSMNKPSRVLDIYASVYSVDRKKLTWGCIQVIDEPTRMRRRTKRNQPRQS
jgi:hypothetical protein